MRVGFVQWPEGLRPHGPEWDRLADEIVGASPDLLVTNELPFGPWLAANAAYDRAAADGCVAVHEHGLQALAALPVAAVLSSRAVWSGERLANEAFAVERGAYRPLHRKRYFPDEPGWLETAWFRPGSEGFRTAEVGGIRVGVMLCTDAMFNEHARALGRQGADLIAIPRAAGPSAEIWHAAGRMAAVVSGAYVISSNRVGTMPGGPAFGGGGFAYLPDGALLATMGATETLAVVEIDAEISARQRAAYPCYVAEPATTEA
ncbi:carbon-nitrogen hydrolase family protein [Methylorubrum extorquens]|uniref:Carbon-nitrogen hydrolase family protein n=1 Tax=Methylorubrum extorquens TaxID=408 RepID=A0A1S1P3V6_METEX|nr:carbon-nitrogen hydrolase family protein [Methylorubrum extorquens]